MNAQLMGTAATILHVYSRTPTNRINDTGSPFNMAHVPCCCSADTTNQEVEVVVEEVVAVV